MSSEENIIEPTSHYIWKIPNIGVTQSELCIVGYIRMHSLKYIPSEIARLCVNFFTDIHIMNKIKHALNRTCFKSDIFCVKNFKFRLEIWPNGYEAFEVGTFDIWLELVSLSNKISDIEFQFTISIQEINTDWIDCTDWTGNANLNMNDRWVIWKGDDILTEDIQNIDSLTIKFQINDIISILDDNGLSLLDTYTQYQNPLISTIIGDYQWKINKHLNPKIQNEYHSSYFKMHNISWILKFKVDKQQVWLNMVAIPPNISTVWVYCSLSLKDKNKMYWHMNRVMRFSDDLASTLWSDIDVGKLDNFDNFTIKLEMLLIDIYSIDGKPINNISHYDEGTEMKIKPFSYVWNVSSRFLSKELLLITGFLRGINNTIHSEILTLCQTFFTDDNIEQMRDICDVKCGEIFDSKICNIGDLKWCLQIYPNGDAQDTKGFVQFCIRLISLSPKITKLSVNYNTQLLETNAVYNDTIVFTFDDDGRRALWTDKSSKTDTIKYFKSLTFKLDLKIFNIYKSDGTIIPQHELKTKYFDAANYTHCTDSFQWIINDIETVSSIKNAHVGDRFYSEFFRLHDLFVWYIELYPLGMVDDSCTSNTHVDLYLSVASFPPNILSVAFKYKLWLKETQTCFENFTQFAPDFEMSVGWPTQTLKHIELQRCDIYTFDVTISIIDIYDIDGNVITKDYVNNKVNIERPISFKSEEYIWRIDDINIIDLWKTTPNIIDGFKSNIFMMHGFEWFMEVSANGTDTESIGSFNWYLNLLSLSNKIKRITFYYNILLEETKTIFNVSTSFDHEYCSEGWGDDHIKRDAIKHLKSFTFKLNIKLFDVFDIDNNIINNYSLFQSPIRYDIPPGEFTWKITNKTEIRYITNSIDQNCCLESKVFEIYNCKWCLELYPSSDDQRNCELCLRLLTLSKNIGAICIKYELCHVETNTIYCEYSQFYDGSEEWLSEVWPKYKLKTKQLENLKLLTFKVKISLLGAYHKQTGYPIRNNFTDDYKESKVRICSEPEECYQWKISNSILNLMKNAENGEFIQSPIFELNGLKWIERLYPNGSSASSNGWSDWYITLISFPSNISGVMFQFEIVLYNENNDRILVKDATTGTTNFNDDLSSFWWGNKKIEFKKLINFKELNFNFSISVLEIFDNDKNRMDNINKELSRPRWVNNTLTLVDEYIWKIIDLKQVKNANNEQYFESNIFNMHKLNWRLRLYNEMGEGKLQLYLNELPNEYNIKSISIQFQFEVKEIQKYHFYLAHFRDGHLCKGFKGKTKAIKYVDQLTIRAIITVIDMFDDKGNVIPFEMNDEKISNQQSMTRFVSFSKK